MTSALFFLRSSVPRDLLECGNLFASFPTFTTFRPCPHQRTPPFFDDSMATLIGLSIRVKLLRALPSRFKVTVCVTPGSHASEAAVNKQLADKERVAAALENAQLLDVVNKCIAHTDRLDEDTSSATLAQAPLF